MAQRCGVSLRQRCGMGLVAVFAQDRVGWSAPQVIVAGGGAEPGGSALGASPASSAFR